MKRLPEFNNFIQLLKVNQRLKISFILIFFALSFIPLSASSFPRLINSVDYQIQTVSVYPVNSGNQPPPIVSARSVVVIDQNSKAIIYQKNPDLKLLPASLTKIMTAIISLENYHLDDVVTVGEIITEPNIMKLIPGEQITVENLLSGLLIYSANDAAIALAEFHPQGTNGFIKAMNQKAKDLFLNNTQFANPVGFDDFGQYTTVHDLSLLTAYALDNPVFSKIVAITNLTVKDVKATVSHELENNNELLGKISGLTGVKTGRTDLAGECLITYTKRNNYGVIVVVLNSLNRFDETEKLIDWVFLNHHWENLPTTRL